MYDFKESLAFAKSVEDSGLFNKYYRHIWEGDVRYVHFHEELSTQKRGIDKTILFMDGTKLTVDEKYDRYPSENIFVELYTDIDTNRKGWLFKNECDYVVYGWTDGVVTWLPMELLRTIYYYHQHDGRHDWVSDKTVKFVKNRGYEGMGVLVNRERLEKEVYVKASSDNTPQWQRVCPVRRGWLSYRGHGGPREWREEDGAAHVWAPKGGPEPVRRLYASGEGLRVLSPEEIRLRDDELARRRQGVRDDLEGV